MSLHILLTAMHKLIDRSQWPINRCRDDLRRCQTAFQKCTEASERYVEDLNRLQEKNIELRQTHASLLAGIAERDTTIDDLREKFDHQCDLFSRMQSERTNLKDELVQSQRAFTTLSIVNDKLARALREQCEALALLASDVDHFQATLLQLVNMLGDDMKVIELTSIDSGDISETMMSAISAAQNALETILATYIWVDANLQAMQPSSEAIQTDSNLLAQESHTAIEQITADRQVIQESFKKAKQFVASITKASDICQRQLSVLVTIQNALVRMVVKRRET